MRYDRVDFVGDGANGHADILLAKNRNHPPKVRLVSKSMGTYECKECGTPHSSVKKSASCSNCGSRNFNYTEVHVTKKSSPVLTKKVPKNDDATNAGQYTFEDEQYDQDDGENGKALGDAVEKNGWFAIDRGSPDNGGWLFLDKAKTVQTGGNKNGTDVDSVDNEAHEDEMEGEDSDKDIELLSMQLPSGTRPDRRSGYKSLSSTTKVTQKSRFGKKKPFKKERPGMNSYDYGDQGSQEVAESAEQMYRSESQPTDNSQEHRDSTRSDASTDDLGKARRRKGKEGLRILENGNQGVNATRGVSRNGTNTDKAKKTSAGRTAVRPPGNPLDKSRKLVLRKSQSSGEDLPTLEALNLGVQLAENLGEVLRKGKPELYESVMTDFIETMNVAAGEWFAGSTITKSSTVDAQAEDVAERVYEILTKASPASEMSDDVAEGADADEEDKVANNSVGKLKTSYPGNNKNEKDETVGKSKDTDPYAGLSPVVKARFERLDELEEQNTQREFLAKARELRHLPGYDEEKLAKQLRSAYEGGQEAGDYLFQTLSAAANNAEDSNVFKQFGMPGAGSVGDDDPMARAYAYADSNISKSGDGPTREQLVVNYMREHPSDFYQTAKS
jgi:hypothetical protein